MPKVFSQLEFKWTSWLRKAKSKRNPKTAARHEDGGLSAWCSEQADKLSLSRLSRRVKVCWNSRMSSTAGQASWPDCVIPLNPRLKQIGEEEMWNTLRHELAHLIAYERCGRRRIAPHGPEWQQACADLGIPDERPYHELALPSRKLKPKHLYVCRKCKTEWFRVRPLRRAVACYDCCRKHSHGQYDERFRMVKIPLVR